MLYDILIIDDDFSGETVLDELTLSSATQGNIASWDNTIMPLYLGLTRENLKVIWSTGELDDLEKLEKHQLSTIRYIICDLHLAGINDNSDERNIIGKIGGILRELNENLNEKDISFLINSKYIEDHSGIESDLQRMLNKSYPKKYAVTAFLRKNAITHEQKQELLDTSLLSHIKEQIIKKHLEIERHFNKKIDVKKAALRKLSFSAKHKRVKRLFDLNGHNTKIDKFNESRNYVAHNKINSLSDLQDIEILKEFKRFSDLTDYLDEIDKLIEIIRDVRKNK